MESKAEIISFYWNHRAIIARIDKDDEIDYLSITKEQFKQYSESFVRKQTSLLKYGEAT